MCAQRLSLASHELTMQVRMLSCTYTLHPANSGSRHLANYSIQDASAKSSPLCLNTAICSFLSGQLHVNETQSSPFASADLPLKMHKLSITSSTDDLYLQHRVSCSRAIIFDSPSGKSSDAQTRTHFFSLVQSFVNCRWVSTTSWCDSRAVMVLHVAASNYGGGCYLHAQALHTNVSGICYPFAATGLETLKCRSRCKECFSPGFVLQFLRPW